ncbi:uncharacterized protein PV06_11041 [Exophiala oligosperma]|uniref:RING-type domain-containing protein n=1 Tax=Exophiala oligosperma TaxID=215243 RepID=A0A0D2D390_9EURO|nr:uncharacterized protein PV06_11041 [Exophiala oligosperma]KIW36745.1 hypothetical protein PV06_11041 [Exophiala oligosperma]
MQPTLKLDHFLNDDDCDIQVGSGSVVDAALDMRKKFSSVLSQARHRKPNKLNLNMNDSNRTFELSARLIETSSDNKSAACDSVKMITDRYVFRIKQWPVIWARKELEKVDHPRCTICTVAFRNNILPGGHTSWRECLDFWLGQGNSCPWCKRSFEAGDIRDVYL